MGFKVGSTAKVTDTKISKNGKPMVRLKISKLVNNEYKQTFDSYVLLASNSAVNPPQKRDLIRIKSCDVEKYEDRWFCYMYDHEVLSSASQAPSGPSVSINFIGAPRQNDKDDKIDLPF